MHLSKAPASVSELAKPLKMSMPSVLQHLQVLEECGLIRSEKVGRVRTCQIERKVLSVAERWIVTLREQHVHRIDPARIPRRGELANNQEEKIMSVLAHETVIIERTGDAPVARVYAAYVDPIARAKWGVPSDTAVLLYDTTSFKVGGYDRFQCGDRKRPKVPRRSSVYAHRKRTTHHLH